MLSPPGILTVSQFYFIQQPPGRDGCVCTCVCASQATCDGMTGYGKCLCGHMAAEMVLIGRHSVLGGGTMAGMWRDDHRLFITRHLFT